MFRRILEWFLSGMAAMIGAEIGSELYAKKKEKMNMKKD